MYGSGSPVEKAAETRSQYEPLSGPFLCLAIRGDNCYNNE